MDRAPLDDLRAGDSPRRSGLDPEHVTTLANAGTWPPVLVHRATMVVIDGAHRIAAARQLGLEDVEVSYFDGPAHDIFLEAVTHNVVRGLALSSADRRAAVVRILRDHPHLSDRQIAQRVGVRPGTVGDLRGEVPGETTARLGLDGRQYPTNSAERRKLAEEYLAAHPDATLKRVADAAGIAVSTAKNIRDRLRAGATRHDAQRPAASNRVETASTRMVGDAATTLEMNTLLYGLSTDPSVRDREGGRVLLLQLRRALNLPLLVSQRANALPAHQLQNAARLLDLCGKHLSEASQHLAVTADL